MQETAVTEEEEELFIRDMLDSSNKLKDRTVISVA